MILILSVKGFFKSIKNGRWKEFFVHIDLYSFYHIKNSMFGLSELDENHIVTNIIGCAFQ